jgi:hypothetical protein
MFVSSYNTYATVNNSPKVNKKDNVESKESSFASNLSTKTISPARTTENLPVNYISDYKILSNQQKLDQNSQKTQEEKKYSKINASVNAKDAYSENSKMFSFLLEPKASLDQTPKVNEKLPDDLQDAQEQNLRHTMVNTYIANDNYYKITA